MLGPVIDTGRTKLHVTCTFSAAACSIIATREQNRPPSVSRWTVMSKGTSALGAARKWQDRVSMQKPELVVWRAALAARAIRMPPGTTVERGHVQGVWRERKVFWES